MEPEASAPPAKKKSKKKLKKTYNLLDFVVVKQKGKKSEHRKVVKVSKQIQKRGKVRKKKITTIKKKIIKERLRKRAVDLPCEVFEETQQLETNVELESSSKVDTLDNALAIEISQLQLSDTASIDDIALKSVLTPTAPPFIPSKSFKTSSPLVESPSLTVAANESIPVTANEALPVTSVHSKNFREYCNHFITPEIKQHTELVLKDLFKFQENKFQQNPVKAKANKRYVVGFKEVKKFLIVKRLKLVIIAPDLERNAKVDELVDEIKALVDQHKIPCVFSIKRRHIGYLLLKKVSVSVVGIFDYQGTDETVKQLLKLVKEQKTLYKNKTKGAS